MPVTQWPKLAPHAIHLVDVAHARNVVLVGETPVGFRLRLYASNAVEHDDCTVQHAQTPVYLDGEIDMARGVDDVDLMALPLSGDPQRSGS
jgi:hypothetical protein